MHGVHVEADKPCLVCSLSFVDICIAVYERRCATGVSRSRIYVYIYVYIFLIKDGAVQSDPLVCASSFNASYNEGRARLQVLARS